MNSSTNVFDFQQKNGSNGLPKLVIYTSGECHYSIFKFAVLLGIGEANVVSVKTNEVGEMDPLDLENNIADTLINGGVPLMVVATLGKLGY